jgi:uncharacterized membrane protein
MTFMKTLELYALTVPVFFTVDMVWLGLVARTFYRRRLGHLMAERVNWPAEKNSFGRAVVSGALFGFIAYATYDLTNLATLKNWPAIVTVVDLAWGMVLTGAVSGIGFVIASKAM